MFRLKIYLLLVVIMPTFGYGQNPNFLENIVEQTPFLFYNSIESLRFKGVTLVKDSLDADFNLIHEDELTKISHELTSYVPVYCDLDTCDPYEQIDSIKTVLVVQEDHYFAEEQLISSYYYAQHLDSVKVDTSSVVKFFYENQVLKKSTKRHFLLRDTLIKENFYFWTNQQLDSIHSYSNAILSTFDTKYTDTLRLSSKQRFEYDRQGRLVKKESFLRSWSKVLETYDYPNSLTKIISEAPFHPIRGCIMDQSVSFFEQTIIVYQLDGLVKRAECHYYIKNKNEPWFEDDEPIIYNLLYSKK